MKTITMSAVSAALVSLAIVGAPPANALQLGNFNLIIPDRADFHTWLWSLGPCTAAAAPAQPDCAIVVGIPQPVAKAFSYRGEAHLVDGHATLTVDDPFGLRCGNIYYGSTSMTHDVYTWDPATMAGTLVSSFDAGCDGAPGTLTYPFSLARM